MKKTFMNKLAEKIQHLGKVEQDSFDNEEDVAWIELKKGKHTLTILFNKKGDKIIDIELHEDIIEVTNQKKIF